MQPAAYEVLSADDEHNPLLGRYRKIRKQFMEELLRESKHNRNAFVERLDDTTIWRRDIEHLNMRLINQQKLILETWNIK